MYHKENQYTNHAIIKRDDLIFVLIKLDKSDIQGFDMFHVYHFDDITQRIDRSNKITIYIHRFSKRRYAPYIYNTIIIASYAFSTKQLFKNLLQLCINNCTIKFFESDIDTIFESFINDYDNAKVDIPTMIGP